MADIKISELSETTDLNGLYTIGTDKNNASKKVSLQFLKEAASYANMQGDYAKEVGDSYGGELAELESKIDGITLTYNALDYLKVPTIAVGEKTKITIVSSAHNGGARFYGKTSLPDSTYQTIGHCELGQTIEFTADREINYIKMFNDNSAVPVVIKIAPDKTIVDQIAFFETSVTDLQKEVGGITLTYNAFNYLEVPTIAVGEKTRITLMSSANNGSVLLYAKTNTADSAYLSIGECQLGQTIEFISDREINYIKVYNDAGAVPIVIKVGSENALVAKVSSLSDNIANIIGDDLKYNGNPYLRVPTIAKGEKFCVTLTNVSSDVGSILYAKTKLEDSNYQTIGSLFKVGDSLVVVANIEINYLRVYGSTSAVYPLTIKLEMADSLSVRVRALESQSSDTPCMYNPPMNFGKADLKVFDIGNSYTQDAQAYLPNIISSARLENNFSLYRAFRPSGSFKSWVDCWNNRDNQTYNIVKCAGNDIAGITGNGNANDGAVFRNSLTSVKWDVILIHQVSGYANNFADWGGNGNGGYLKELIQILRKTNPQSTIGFLLVHSYRSNYGSNTEGSSLERWGNIAKATKDLKNAYGIDFIIPYGTAVQNLRASSLSDEFEFSEDGTHLADGLGDYVASCCYFQSLFAPRFGVSILGNAFSNSSIDESVGGRKAITPENALVAQKAAMLATYNMWEVMNPDDYEL